MRYKIELLVMASVFCCLLLVQNVSASYTSKTIYLDGQYVTDACGADVLLFGEAIRLGGAGDDGWISNEYIGKLAEFAVYKSVLSTARIESHYDANDSNDNYTAAVQADNPVLWLRFRDASTNSGDPAKNSGSSSTNGRYFISGGSPFSIVQGIDGNDSNALNIPDSEPNEYGHKVEVANNGEFDANQLTVEIWVNFTDINDAPDNGYPVIFNTIGGPGLIMNQEGNSVNVSGGSDNYLDLPYDINDAQWHHIVITYNSVYEAPVLPSAAAYNQEVAADHPIIWLKFDSSDPCNSGEDANHWVGYGPGGSIEAKTGGVGKSLRCSGVAGAGAYDAAVAAGPNAPTTPYLVYSDNYAFAPNDITFEIWYKTFPAGQPQPETYGYFYQQTGPWTNEPCGPAVGLASGNFRIWGGSGGWETGVNAKLDGQWHHLVVTYDENDVDPRNMVCQLYLDGFERGNYTFTGANAKLGPEMYHMLIGGRTDMGFTYNIWIGYLDEFAVYKGILDPNRVLAHYAAWQLTNCQDAIDRGYGTIADLNSDCKVNFEDIATFALNWRQCNDPCDPGCAPPEW
jgi:hypothetical protein